MHQWFAQHAIPISVFIEYIPVIATVVTSLFSVILARATLRYVEATDKGLALAREEFEREWSPELHVKLEKVSSSDARIVVTNLAKVSVLLQLVQLRQVSQLVPFERCVLNDPLVGGLTWNQSFGKSLLACTGEDFEGPVAASVTFYASGRMFRTDWFRFQVVVRNGSIARLDPINIPARRVRILEHKGPDRRKIELVKDVTGELAVRAHGDGNSN